MDQPFQLFKEWYAKAAADRSIKDASAMVLATSDLAGRPSARMVLLKAFDQRGFVFYTNIDSPKSRDIQANPQAALCFHWASQGRQIRIHGSVEPVSENEADTYFSSRPRLSQLGAWASRQSESMAGPYALESAISTLALQYFISTVPRPPNWSGYRVLPDEIEFWTEKPFRAHQRTLFTLSDLKWERQLLYP